MADAPKRYANPKRKERRQKSYLRGQAKNKRNEARNSAREEANRAALRDIGGTIQTKSYLKDVPYVDKHGITRYKTVEVSKRESPSEALARTKRQNAGWRGHVPMITTAAR